MNCGNGMMNPGNGFIQGGHMQPPPHGNGMPQMGKDVNIPVTASQVIMVNRIDLFNLHVLNARSILRAFILL